MKKAMFYLCKECGNIVALIRSGGGTLVCCDQDMELLDANTVDASQEKHVPVYANEGGKTKVTVGSDIHPMTDKHFIEWIAVVTDSRIDIEHLKPGMEPKAEFTDYFDQSQACITNEDDEIVPNCEGQSCNFEYSYQQEEKVSIYAYCNLHGLWKA